MKPLRFSLKNRIALYYLFLTAGLILLIFIVLYSVVYNTVYNHLDGDLDSEASELMHNIVVINDTIIIANKLEWEEAEHKQIEINPTFMQILDKKGNIIVKTGNLLEESLKFEPYNSPVYKNTKLDNASIRQLQEPVFNPEGKIAGYILVAIPLEESEIVLSNLLIVLITAFPVIILVLFYSTRIIAGQSISPVADIINTAEKITRENLNERISLPHNKDELYRLVITINDLLERLEDTLLREKQFTSDASHELRTPLSVIKGTLEVLIRKPRTTEQYNEKIKYCINEVDNMTGMVEQLLLLARYDAGKIKPEIQTIEPETIITNLLERFSAEVILKNMEIVTKIDPGITISCDVFLLEIILGNIIANSVKYSPENTAIKISVIRKDEDILFVIEDEGFGMDKEQLKKIFDRFYRIDDSRTQTVKGIGLGLSIVKKLSDLLNLRIQIKSSPQKGTIFSIILPAR